MGPEVALEGSSPAFSEVVGDFRRLGGGSFSTAGSPFRRVAAEVVGGSVTSPRLSLGLDKAGALEVASLHGQDGHGSASKRTFGAHRVSAIAAAPTIGKPTKIFEALTYRACLRKALLKLLTMWAILENQLTILLCSRQEEGWVESPRRDGLRRGESFTLVLYFGLEWRDSVDFPSEVNLSSSWVARSFPTSNKAA